MAQNNQTTSVSEKKRKRPEAHQSEESVSRSLSQLSISQQTKKRKKKSPPRNNQLNRETSNVVNHHNDEQQRQQKNTRREDNNSLSTYRIKRLKPCYLKMSDRIFKQMLSNELEHGDNTIQCLDTKEKIQFVRQMTEATNDVYYFDLQRQLWQTYYDIGMEGGLWTSCVSKSFAKHHYTSRRYGFPKHIIEKHQSEIKQQFQQAISILQQYITELEQHAQQWQPTIHPIILSNAINECVKNSQLRLRHEFDYKKKMLTFNSNDHQLIQQFYDLQPSQKQVSFHKDLEYFYFTMV